MCGGERKGSRGRCDANRKDPEIVAFVLALLVTPVTKPMLYCATTKCC